MKRNLTFGWFVAAMFALTGCKGGGAEAPAASPQTPTPPVVDGGAKPTPPTPGEKLPVATDAPKSVPTELQHEGFHYYGLSNAKTVAIEVLGGASKKTGTQTIALKEVKDGKATYEIQRTGGLSDLGNETIILQKDGVYSAGSSNGTIDHPELEVPANLAVGSTWQSKSTFHTSDSHTVTQNTTTKAVKMVPVTTPAGTYQTLLVQSNGTWEIDGAKHSVNAKYWYARDHGTVKAEIYTKAMLDGKVNKLVIQETK